MRLTIKVDVSAKCSGYKNDKELREDIVDFVYEWFVNGADSRNVDFNIKSIKTKSKKKNCKEVCKWEY